MSVTSKGGHDQSLIKRSVKSAAKIFGFTCKSHTNWHELKRKFLYSLHLMCERSMWRICEEQAALEDLWCHKGAWLLPQFLHPHQHPQAGVASKRLVSSWFLSICHSRTLISLSNQAVNTGLNMVFSGDRQSFVRYLHDLLVHFVHKRFIAAQTGCAFFSITVATFMRIVNWRKRDKDKNRKQKKKTYNLIV